MYVSIRAANCFFGDIYYYFYLKSTRIMCQRGIVVLRSTVAGRPHPALVRTAPVNSYILLAIKITQLPPLKFVCINTLNLTRMSRVSFSGNHMCAYIIRCCNCCHRGSRPHHFHLPPRLIYRPTNPLYFQFKPT